MAKPPSAPKSVETQRHDDATRRNIPTAEYQSVLQKAQQDVVQKRYLRNTDLDPQLMWRGKDEQDWSDLVVNALRYLLFGDATSISAVPRRSSSLGRLRHDASSRPALRGRS